MMALAILITNIYVVLAIALGIFGISFFLLPFLYSKFPNVFLKIIEIASYKQTIETTYYFLISLVLPGLEQAKKDEIWSYIQKTVTTAEELAIAGTISKEERKPYVTNLVKELMIMLEIDYTPEVEAFISNVIELVVTYLDLRGPTTPIEPPTEG